MYYIYIHIYIYIYTHTHIHIYKSHGNTLLTEVSSFSDLPFFKNFAPPSFNAR